MRRWELLLVAIKHGIDGAPQEVTIGPPPSYIFRDNDVLLLCGRTTRLEAFTR